LLAVLQLQVGGWVLADHGAFLDVVVVRAGDMPLEARVLDGLLRVVLGQATNIRDQLQLGPQRGDEEDRGALADLRSGRGSAVDDDADGDRAGEQALCRSNVKAGRSQS